MQSTAIFFTAALFEIAGCFAVWGWWRLDTSPIWWISAVLALFTFAWLLTLVDAEQTDMAMLSVATSTSLAWLWAIEGHRSGRWDTTGAVICLIRTAVILIATRSVYSDPRLS